MSVKTELFVFYSALFSFSLPCPQLCNNLGNQQLAIMINTGSLAAPVGDRTGLELSPTPFPENYHYLTYLMVP